MGVTEMKLEAIGRILKLVEEPALIAILEHLSRLKKQEKV